MSDASGEAWATSRATPPRLLLVARDIKLSHSVFALPFALLAMCLAAAWADRLPSALEIALVVVCMVLARTVAMATNRWADAKLDAANPRTARRALPSGALGRGYMLGVAIICAAAFVISTAGFWLWRDNPWPLVLAPVVLAWLVLYSFTKRFTWLCHLFLGSALALSPLAAALAIEPGYLREPTVYYIAVMVFAWVAGFDIIYALQDVAVDRAQRLYSMPARLGVEPALWISRVLHVVSVAALVLAWQASPLLAGAFALGIVLVAGLLVVEHALVWGSRTHHIPIAFLTVNGIISLLLGALGVVDVVMR